MSLGKKMLKLAGVGMLCLGLFAGLSGAATACDTVCYKSVYVTTYESYQVPCTTYVTLYDHCGRPYQAARTYYKTVSVPVQKLVTVAY